jgi:hyaluronan synthase
MTVWRLLQIPTGGLSTGSGRLRLNQAVLLAVCVAVAVVSPWKDWSPITGKEIGRGQVIIRDLVLATSGIAAVGTLWRLWIWRHYQPWPAIDHKMLPAISVVIPVYNEGRAIMETLESVVHCGYPRKKLQVVVIDDGSQDDSGAWIRHFIEEHPGSIEFIKLGHNRGKRAALFVGYSRASGQVVVTIDSDCILERDAIKHLVAPLIADPQLGAVAGQVKIRNDESGLIRQMLSVSFALAFDFGRSVQSVLRVVFCTPGAFSAYRNDALKPILTEWAQQTFWGRPSRIAEDRALTNLLLKAGWHTAYQSTAVARTAAPETLGKLWRMYLRWARGDVRESFRYAHTAATRAMPTRRANVNFAISLVNTVTTIPVLLWVLACIAANPWATLSLLAWTGAGSTLVMGWYAWNYGGTKILPALAYVFFWFLFCSWITPWALLTFRDDRWLTRSTE